MDTNRILAEKVMGLPLGPVKGWYREGLYGAKAGIFIKDWNPLENIAQAMEVLDKFSSWELFKTDANEYGCNLYPMTGEDFVFGGYCDTPSEAICEAALAAIGGE